MVPISLTRLAGAPRLTGFGLARQKPLPEPASRRPLHGTGPGFTPGNRRKPCGVNYLRMEEFSESVALDGRKSELEKCMSPVTPNATLDQEINPWEAQSARFEFAARKLNLDPGLWKFLAPPRAKLSFISRHHG